MSKSKDKGANKIKKKPKGGAKKGPVRSVVDPPGDKDKEPGLREHVRSKP